MKVKTNYTSKFRRKHILENKIDKTDAEISELNELIQYFNKFLHRISPNESYKPF